MRRLELSNKRYVSKHQSCMAADLGNVFASVEMTFAPIWRIINQRNFRLVVVVDGVNIVVKNARMQTGWFIGVSAKNR